MCRLKPAGVAGGCKQPTPRFVSIALNASWGLRTLGWLDIMLGGAFLALFKHRAEISLLLRCALRNIWATNTTQYIVHYTMPPPPPQIISLD